MLKIIYFENQDKYFSHITESISKLNLDNEISITHTQPSQNAASSLLQILELNFDALLINFDLIKDCYLEFCNFLRRNSKLKNANIIFLRNQVQEGIETESLNSQTPFIVKTFEGDELIHHLIKTHLPHLKDRLGTMLEAPFSQVEEEIFSPLQLVSVNRDTFSFRSNSSIPTGKNSHVHVPQLQERTKSGAHTVKRSIKGFTTPAYAYHFEAEINFCKSVPESRYSLLSKNLAYETDSLDLKGDFFQTLAEVETELNSLSLLAKPKSEKKRDEQVELQEELAFGAKALFNKDLEGLGESHSFQKTRVSVYSQNYSPLSIADSSWTNFVQSKDYHFAFRDKLLDAEREISQDLPDIIIYEYENQNSIKAITSIISQFMFHKDYFPFIILFNFKGQEIAKLRDDLHYHFIISSPGSFDTKFLDAVAKLYKRKADYASKNKANRRMRKVAEKNPALKNIDLERYQPKEISFDKLTGKAANIALRPEKAKYLYCSENELVFVAKQNLENKAIFSISAPVQACIKILTKTPHPENGTYLYEALIFGLDEVKKSELRQKLTKLFTEHQLKPEALLELNSKIKEIKREFEPA